MPDKKPWAVDELSEEFIELLANSKMSPEHDYLNDLLTSEDMEFINEYVTPDEEKLQTEDKDKPGRTLLKE